MNLEHVERSELGRFGEQLCRVVGLNDGEAAFSIESADELMRRIDEAARYLPLEQLALSPQCGFASGLAGNQISEDDQWRKVDLLVSVAQRVWG